MLYKLCRHFIALVMVTRVTNDEFVIFGVWSFFIKGVEVVKRPGTSIVKRLTTIPAICLLITMLFSSFRRMSSHQKLLIALPSSYFLTGKVSGVIGLLS